MARVAGPGSDFKEGLSYLRSEDDAEVSVHYRSSDHCSGAMPEQSKYVEEFHPPPDTSQYRYSGLRHWEQATNHWLYGQFYKYVLFGLRNTESASSREDIIPKSTYDSGDAPQWMVPHFPDKSSLRLGQADSFTSNSRCGQDSSSSTWNPPGKSGTSSPSRDGSLIMTMPCHVPWILWKSLTRRTIWKEESNEKAKYFFGRFS